jgi:hypothetical protein
LLGEASGALRGAIRKGLKRRELRCGIRGGFGCGKLASDQQNDPSGSRSSSMPYRAGVLETGVIGGVGSMRRDLFAGCHFCAFPGSQSLVYQRAWTEIVHGPGKSLVLYKKT